MEARRLAASSTPDIMFPAALIFPVVRVRTLAEGNTSPLSCRLAGLKSNKRFWVGSLTA